MNWQLLKQIQLLTEQKNKLWSLILTGTTASVIRVLQNIIFVLVSHDHLSLYTKLPIMLLYRLLSYILLSVPILQHVSSIYNRVFT